MPRKTKAGRAAYMRDYRAKKKKEESTNSKRREQRRQRRVLPPRAVNDPAGELASWAKKKLKVPMGRLRGEPFIIDDWQLDFLRAALRPEVFESGLSVARKNGKSGVIGAVCLGYLCGPLATPDWRAVVTSLTGALAKELRMAIEQTAAVSGLEIEVYKSPMPGYIVSGKGGRMDFLAADKGTGHAVGADLAIIDEAGLLLEEGRDLWEAMMSSVSGRDGQLMGISIQGEGPMFAEMKERGGEKGVVFHDYSCDNSVHVDDEQAWHQANPGLQSGIKSIEYMRHRAQRALSNPSTEARFRSLDLNCPQDPDREMICSVTDWQECLTEQPPERDGVCVLGVDLGGSASMTAAVALWPRTGRTEAWGAFPSQPGLRRRGRADGVGDLYVNMQNRGEIRTMGHRTTPVAQFLQWVIGDLSGQHILMAGADRYRKAEMEEVLAEAALFLPMIWRGQGAAATADGSHDVRAFQARVLTRRFLMKPSLLMAHAISESALRRDGSGNPAIDKSRSRGRIDALQAGVIAAGLGQLSGLENRRPTNEDFMV